MPNYLQINIPESCHENWNEMLPNQKGRHCESCQKTVVDFTNMTDAELISFFKKNTSNTCGRFASDQLERDMLIPKKKIHWMKYFLQVAIPAFLLSLKTSAKASFANTHKIEIYPSKKVIQGDTIVVEKNMTTGKVVDEKGYPLPDASVMVKGKNKGVLTDMNGEFSLRGLNPTNVIIVSYVGFSTKEIAVHDIDPKKPIVLIMQGQLMGDIVVVKSTKRKKVSANKQAGTITTCSAKIYPNPIPSSGILNINWTNAEAGNYSIQITNLQGQVVQTEKLELGKKQLSSSLQLKNLIAGNYAVIITNTKTGKHFSHQLIVQ